MEKDRLTDDESDSICQGLAYIKMFTERGE